MTKELIMYCDESVSEGEFYSNFYGGALVKSSNLSDVLTELKRVKQDQNLLGEVKWQKITENYCGKYIELMKIFFDLVCDDMVKVRIMFSQNALTPKGLTREHQNNRYFLLYYQFVKHAFGLQHCNERQMVMRLRVYFDKLPDTKVKCDSFKDYIHNLSSTNIFREANLTIPKDQIAEVVSHDHDVLQCLDVIMGAMQFRLNNLHKKKKEGTNRRGKRTIAKEKVYKYILSRIRECYPNFNIGISTGTQSNIRNRWLHPYRHWQFRPAEFEYDEKKTKGWDKKDKK